MSGRGCAIGIDFGTESGRALLLDLRTGEELAVSVAPYRRGVIDRELPETGEPLPPDWALQDPDDWAAVIETTVPDVIARAGVSPADVIGIGIDFTSCTVLPVTADGAPLCTLARWRGRRHAWPKLWKHHSAQPVADRLNEVALDRGEPFLQRYGGRISSEWYFPKLIELWLEDREVYDAAVRLPRGDRLDHLAPDRHGDAARAARPATRRCGPGPRGCRRVDYFDAAYPGFIRPGEKLGTTFVAARDARRRGPPELAALLGLSGDVSVAVGNVDSFVSVPGAGVEQAGKYVTVVGTSICDMLVDPTEVRLPGITGVVRDGILPGLYGYEAGQVAVGDMLAWFVELLGAGADGYGELERAGAAIGPGETGLVALDWWNGNRSILADADLTGVIGGLTLQTGRAEIYRALLESIALGNRRIVDNFAEHGLAVDEIVACGGIAERSPLLMQMFADTSGRAVRVPSSSEIPARGSALFGAVAAGAFPDIAAAIAATRPGTARTYTPDPDAKRIYDDVYAVYRNLYETLGRTQVELLHELKRIRNQRRAG